MTTIEKHEKNSIGNPSFPQTVAHIHVQQIWEFIPWKTQVPFF